MRCIAELTKEVERLWASASQVRIYSYRIIVDLKACVNYVSFLLQPSTNSAPPPDHAEEIRITHNRMVREIAYSGKMLTWEEALHSGRQITTDAETWDAPAPVQPMAGAGYEIAVPGLTEVL